MNLRKEIKDSLISFDQIELNEMDKVSLMNRMDLKFVFSIARVPDLLRLLSDDYKVLEINNERALSYSTTYMDTSGYLFYNHHLTGKLERNKVRYRKYEATDTTFLEVKRRTNKNRTIKWRIENKLTLSDQCDPSACEFIRKHVSIENLILKPVLLNGFRRITLVGLNMNERVTIDFDLTFSRPDGTSIALPFISIVELKKERASNLSPVVKILKEFSVRPGGFSKYCIGTSLLYDLPRKNIMKPKLLLIRKIENEYSMFNCA